LPVLNALHREIVEQGQPVMRAKRAATCLLWVAGRSLLQMEIDLSQFGGRSNGISGPIRQTTARTIDVLPLVGKVAALLHPGIDFSERVERLLIRMEVGVTGQVVELARHAMTLLTRKEYEMLTAANLASIDDLVAAEDAPVLAALAGRTAALVAVRRACKEALAIRERLAKANVPILPVYVA
jgi:hypothetical protein